MARNHLGPIARTYDELQSIPLLTQALEAGSVPLDGSRAQAHRACWQSAELGIIGMSLMVEALSNSFAAPNEGWKRDSAARWLNSFAQLTFELLLTARRVDRPDEIFGDEGHVSSSPNYKRLIEAEEALSRQLAETAEASPFGSPLTSEAARDFLRYVQARRNIDEYGWLGQDGSSYESYCQPDLLYLVATEIRLTGPTAFDQFRLCHQIPEVIAPAVSAHVLQATDLMNGERYSEARELLERADRLLPIATHSIMVLDRCLNASDYHAIRENLGVTSGSHSEQIHSRLFLKVWPSLLTAAQRAAASSELEAVGCVVHARSIGLEIDRWRLAHLNFPRLNLGGPRTGAKSLTGAPDAVETVLRMRHVAEQVAPTSKVTNSELQLPPSYLSSFEDAMLDEIASETKQRFRDVQERTGYFARPPDRGPRG